VVGEAVDAARGVQLGHLRKGQGAQVTMSMVVRDLDRELAVEEIAVSPEFLQVRVEPAMLRQKPADGPAGPLVRVYRIHLSVPPDAPPGNYLGRSAGHFALTTDHPKVKVVKLKVEFVIEE
jgi:hypothetical protein